MAVIPQNRDLDGLILDMRLWENLMLARPLRERMTSHGWLDASRAIDLSRELIARFRIRAPVPRRPPARCRAEIASASKWRARSRRSRA